MIGVSFPTVTALILALASISIVKMAWFPFPAAKWRGVRPVLTSVNMTNLITMINECSYLQQFIDQWDRLVAASPVQCCHAIRRDWFIHHIECLQHLKSLIFVLIGNVSPNQLGLLTALLGAILWLFLVEL